MKKTIILAAISVLSITSCVSKKDFTELESRYAKLKKEKRAIADKNKDCQEEKAKLTTDLANAQAILEKLKGDKATLASNLADLEKMRNELKAAYKKLEQSSNTAIAQTSAKNKALLQQLEDKEKALTAESKRLADLQKELDMRAQKADELQATLAARSKRVNELENALAAKDANMKRLKNAISKALTHFEGKGLTVEQRNGKVYVSMENKLLFQSGSWKVGTEGIKAVTQLGTVLAQNPEIKVLIEGHTDNDALKGKGEIANNWDLSTKRATAIVAILQKNKNINPESLTAAGRSEYAPITSNDTAEGKAKNRRIEVILTPKLDEVTKLLNEVK